MFYEGNEKRLEITTTVNLLNFDECFWKKMVQKAGAYILSGIENGHLKAFLLSESSLFVWKHRVLLITCGETHLLQAALYFQKRVHREQITSLLFQRHQEIYPERQKSNFQQDCLLLQTQLKGDSHHWRKDYCGDIFVFGNNQQTFATKNILMMHGLSGDFFDQLQSGKAIITVVTSALQLQTYFSHFTFDQHCFSPNGYSLNAIDGEHYFTVHITPEKLSSYLSIESNLPTHEMMPFHHHLLLLFNPQRHYLMTFSNASTSLVIDTTVIPLSKTKPLTLIG